MSPSSNPVKAAPSSALADLRKWAIEKSLAHWAGKTTDLHIEVAEALEAYVLGTPTKADEDPPAEATP